MSSVLIVVAHPDDEILWIWWTIQKLISSWEIVSILLLSRPWVARPLEDPEIRLEAFTKIMKILGITSIFYKDFPDTCFDTVRFLEIIQSIEEVIDFVKPEIVYTHFYNDLNIDHSITSRAVITALRPIERYQFVKKIFLFEVPSTTEYAIGIEQFKPNHYEDITDFFVEKIRLLWIYTTELRNFPYPLSQEWVEILAKKRGMESYFNYAEAFMLYRSRQ